MIASVINFVQKWMMFPRFYRVAKHDGMTRRYAFMRTLYVVYGIRVKRFWRVVQLVRFLRQRKTVCPTRSPYWVVRMWWRYV